MQPDEGEIKLEGKTLHFKSPMDARQAGIETVYQNLALSPALSISDNMFLGREIRKDGVLDPGSACSIAMRWRNARERNSRSLVS